MKIMFKAALGAALLATASLPAAAQEVTLTIHHFLSPKAPAQAAFIEPWAKKIEEESNGRIKFEIFPSMSLGGKPPELYQQVRDGVADIVWTLPGYTPGVFPHAEVFELPTVHQGSAEVTNMAIQDIFDTHLAEDFKDVKPLLLHVHTGQVLHTVDTRVDGPEDVKGLKLRVPSRTGAWVIEAMGAEPVGMPVPDLPQALSRNVVDGAFIPFEVVLPLKVHELTKYHIDRHDNKRFGTSTFLFAMNKDRYESLPDDLKAIIDANIGPELARRIGQVWDGIEPKVAAIAEERGNELIELSPEADAAFQPMLESVEERWAADMKERGIDAQALLKAAKDAIAKHAGM